MKTQAVSNQNFAAGELKFIRKVSVDGTIDDLKNVLLPQIDKTTLLELKRIISQKPYDLFISRAKDMRGFYSVDANTDFVNVLGADAAKKGNTSIVYAGRLERLLSAASEAMDSFENAADYQKLTTPKNIFQRLWKKLTSN